MLRADLGQLPRIWFGLKPFLTSRWSQRGLVDPRMSLGYRIPLAYKLITLSRWLRSDHRLFTGAEYGLHEEVLQRLREQVGEGGVAEPQPLPEVDASIDPAEFIERFVRSPHPVVIRGLARDMPAVKRWNKAFLEERCGDTTVHAYEADYATDSGEVEYTELKTTLREAVNTPGVYLDTSRDVFLEHPELEEDISLLQTWGRFLGGAIYLMPQIFIGENAEGAPFHCANGWNFFVMVNGEKEWTFVDPEHTLLLGAVTHPTVITVEACVTGKGGTWRDDHELYARYCPRFTCRVKSGDVIMNPPWWWHEIKNTGPFSIGISSRWLKRGYAPTNSFFDTLSYLSPGMWKLKMSLMKSLGGAPPPDGEDVLRNSVGRKLPRHQRYYRDFTQRAMRHE